MRCTVVVLVATLSAHGLLGAASGKVAWPLSLQEGLPATLPGYAAAPRDPLPDTDENEMGIYTEVSRFFQRIESSTSTKQFRLVVQDYGSGKDLMTALRDAVTLAGRAPKVEAREVKLGTLTAFVVTDRSGINPTTLVTVVVTPSRLVLGQGANVAGDEALKLISRVDFVRVANAK
jgi:hypothetical protein